MWRQLVRQPLCLPLLVASMLLSDCVLVPGNTPSFRQSDPSNEARKLYEIFESFFDAELALFPTFATEIGEHRYDDQLEIAISEEHISAYRRPLQQALKQLAEIRRDEIKREDRLYLDVLTRNLRHTLEGLAFKQQLLPVRQLASLAVEFPLLGSGAGVHPFRTVKDYENFLKRIEAFGSWVDTAIANMRRGIETEIVQPKVVIERTLPQIEAIIAPDLKASLFYQPVVRMPAEFSGTDRARLTSAYGKAIEQHITLACCCS